MVAGKNIDDLTLNHNHEIWAHRDPEPAPHSDIHADMAGVRRSVEAGDSGIIMTPDLYDLQRQGFYETRGFLGGGPKAADKFATMPGLLYGAFNEAAVTVPSELGAKAFADGTNPRRNVHLKLQHIPDGVILVDTAQHCFVRKRVADGTNGKPKLWQTAEDAAAKNNHYVHYFEIYQPTNPSEMQNVGVVTTAMMNEHFAKYGDPYQVAVKVKDANGNEVPALNDDGSAKTKTMYDIPAGEPFVAKGHSNTAAGPKKLFSNVSAFVYDEEGKGHRWLGMSGLLLNPADEFRSPVVSRLSQLINVDVPVDRLKNENSRYPALIDPSTPEHLLVSAEEKVARKRRSLVSTMLGLKGTDPDAVDMAFRDAENSWSHAERKKKMAEAVKKWRDIFGADAEGNTVGFNQEPADRAKLKEFNEWFEANIWKAPEMAPYRVKCFGWVDIHSNGTPLVVKADGKFGAVEQGDKIRLYDSSDRRLNRHLGGKLTRHDNMNAPAFGTYAGGYVIDSVQVDYLKKFAPEGLWNEGIDGDKNGLTRWGERVAKFMLRFDVGTGAAADRSPKLVMATTIAKQEREFKFGAEGLLVGTARLVAPVAVVAGVTAVAVATAGVSIPLVAVASIAGLAAGFLGDASKTQYLKDRHLDLHNWERDAKFPIASIYKSNPPTLARELGVAFRGLSGVLATRFETTVDINKWELRSNVAKYAGYAIAAAGVAAVGSAVVAGVAAGVPVLSLGAAVAAASTGAAGMWTILGGAALASVGHTGRFVTNHAKDGWEVMKHDYFKVCPQPAGRNKEMLADGGQDHFMRAGGFNMKRDEEHVKGADVATAHTIKIERDLGLAVDVPHAVRPTIFQILQGGKKRGSESHAETVLAKRKESSDDKDKSEGRGAA